MKSTKYLVACMVSVVLLFSGCGGKQAEKQEAKKETPLTTEKPIKNEALKVDIAADGEPGIIKENGEYKGIQIDMFKEILR